MKKYKFVVKAFSKYTYIMNMKWHGYHISKIDSMLDEFEFVGGGGGAQIFVDFCLFVGM